MNVGGLLILVGHASAVVKQPLFRWGTARCAGT
jgi:hypothetical protein